MDPKKITWAGNIFQKFEALCLEVEEETIGYFESQAQAVGETVKQFYTEVLQDLLPVPPLSSDTDSMHEDSGDKVCEKPKEKSENKEKLTNAFTVASANGGGVARVVPLIRVREDEDSSCQPHSGLQSMESSLRTESDDSSEFYGFGKNGREQLFPFGTAYSTSSPGECLSDLSWQSCEFVYDYDGFEHRRAKTIASEDRRSDSVLESHDQSKNGSEITADETVLVESNEDIEKEIGVLSLESNAADMCLSTEVSSVGGSAQNKEVRHIELSDEFVWDLATDITAHQSDDSALYETIVLVIKDEHESPPQTDCHNSFEKKVRKSLYSRMMPGRKQLGGGENLNHKVVEASTPKITAESTEKLLSADACDSDWELL